MATILWEGSVSSSRQGRLDLVHLSRALCREGRLTLQEVRAHGLVPRASNLPQH